MPLIIRSFSAFTPDRHSVSWIREHKSVFTAMDIKDRKLKKDCGGAVIFTIVNKRS